MYEDEDLIRAFDKARQALEKYYINNPSDGAAVSASPVERSLSIAVRDAQTAIAMNPRALAQMRCFMVDFKGKGSEGAARDSDVEDVAAMVRRVGGSLASSVESWLKKQPGKLTDRGGGEGGWYFGVHCTPDEAWRLSRDGREMFAKAIKSNLLEINITAWSMSHA
jgi:hypothetical protein